MLGASLAQPGALVPADASREIPHPWRLRPDLMHAPSEPQLVAVLDTNAIATACCMEAGSGHQSLATRLVLTGRVPCFIAEHVPGEIDEHLDRIARKMGVDMEAATAVWRERVAPMFRIVDLPIGEYLRPEIEGIRQPEPAGDPDDWPSLAVAAFLGPAAIITRDRVFYRLGYANKARDWTDTAKALRRAAALEGEQIDRAAFAIMSTQLASAGVGGLVRLGRRFPWTVPVAMMVTALVGRRLWRARADLRAGATQMLDRARPYVSQILTDMAEYAELRAELVTVHDPSWRHESPTERCARTLARSGDAMTPGELRDVMNMTGGERATAAGLKRIMREHPSFVRLPGDRYQLGRPVPVGQGDDIVSFKHS
ncbi:PIN domain-containing protein [Micromonospora purpureochromogenes]|uniref:PIN domain-containing protein n=1 Tax=Micromonospora purpureochromogenes TaxID=47872 RepID=A0A1C4Z9C2_9ACTN|nr:PIN domain-containing protein [Micromonospora purpureochromogenes]